MPFMKNMIPTICFLLCSWFQAHSQGFIVTYETTMSFRIPREELQKIENPYVRQAIEQSIKEQEERMRAPITTRLTIGKGISNCELLPSNALNNRESQVVQTNNTFGVINMNFSYNVSSLGHNTVYKNHQSKLQHIRVTTVEGKEYLIEEPLMELHWRIGNDKREICGYHCVEATAIVSGGKTIQAWYAPDIPVSEGPASYHGLPGLILYLDIDHGNTVFTCKAVEPLENAPEIQIPENIEKISRAQYNAMNQERVQQMEELRNRRNSGSIIIREE